MQQNSRLQEACNRNPHNKEGKTQFYLDIQPDNTVHVMASCPKKIVTNKECSQPAGPLQRDPLTTPPKVSDHHHFRWKWHLNLFPVPDGTCIFTNANSWQLYLLAVLVSAWNETNPSSFTAGANGIVLFFHIGSLKRTFIAHNLPSCCPGLILQPSAYSVLVMIWKNTSF